MTIYVQAPEFGEAGRTQVRFNDRAIIAFVAAIICMAALVIAADLAFTGDPASLKAAVDAGITPWGT
jgi:hypothetical protein